MSTPIHAALESLFAGESLSAQAADAAMTQIMTGEATPALIGAFLACLRLKGETVDEITGCAQAMKRNATQVRSLLGDAPVLDIVGTGGDGTQKFNISTTAAFVVAGHGVKVAKHGNRSNRRAGSADVLEALGAKLQSTPEQVAECVNEVGIAFLFAPSYHPAMRHAIGPRREIQSRTIFNILGPLTNPASPTNMLVGVFAPELTDVMARVLGNMGVQSAYVVHGFYETGTGLDELTPTGPSRVSHLHNGDVITTTFDPAELGMGRATLSDMQGGDGAENARILRGILSGQIRGPKRDAVLLNAAAALSTECGDWQAGLAEATESIDSGAALDALERFIEKTKSFG